MKGYIFCLMGSPGKIYVIGSGVSDRRRENSFRLLFATGDGICHNHTRRCTGSRSYPEKCKIIAVTGPGEKFPGFRGEEMKIRILGTRGEIEEEAPRHLLHSGVLVDRTLLLDLGEKEFLELSPSAILITHLHPDHAFFVRESGPVDVPIYAPEPYKSMDILIPREEFRIGEYTLRAIPTHHSKLVRSLAYRVEKDGQKFLYSGDIIWIDKQYHHLLEDLDLVITDGSYFRKGGMIRRDEKTGQIFGHNGIPDLIQLFSEFTRYILLVHFGSWFFNDIVGSEEKLHQLGQRTGMEVLVGYDGMEIDLAGIPRSGIYSREHLL
jgi:glyoxylase-like metal-dependent hydrolase (beta-lactamase superfamily II)